jgi:hypothetical protein
MSRRWKKAIVALLALLSAGVAVYVLFVLANPILLINEDPRVTVLVDNQPVKFSHGTADLSPWHPSYLVEIRSPRGTERRRIYPWDQSSDSGSVAVDKNGASFDLKSSPVE